MIFLFLLQIFNGVDWDCAAGFHSWNSDSSSRAEHRMETTSPADAERSLSAAWQLAGFRTDSFFHFPDPGKHLMISDLPPAAHPAAGMEFRPAAGIAGAMALLIPSALPHRSLFNPELFTYTTERFDLWTHIANI